MKSSEYKEIALDPEVDSQRDKEESPDKPDLKNIDFESKIKRTALSSFNPNKFNDTKDLWNNKKIMSFINKNSTEGKMQIKEKLLKKQMEEIK